MGNPAQMLMGQVPDRMIQDNHRETDQLYPFLKLGPDLQRWCEYISPGRHVWKYRRLLLLCLYEFLITNYRLSHYRRCVAEPDIS